MIKIPTEPFSRALESLDNPQTIVAMLFFMTIIAPCLILGIGIGSSIDSWGEEKTPANQTQFAEERVGKSILNDCNRSVLTERFNSSKEKDTAVNACIVRRVIELGSNLNLTF